LVSVPYSGKLNPDFFFAYRRVGVLPAGRGCAIRRPVAAVFELATGADADEAPLADSDTPAIDAPLLNSATCSRPACDVCVPLV
jgi:hypothetical protein